MLTKTKNNIKVEKVNIKENIIHVDYTVSEDLQKFFNMENKFKIQYGENIEDVPEEIAIIPFVSNVLPIIWLTNSTLEIERLDENYFKSIEETRKAFQNIYKDAKFEGKIIVKKLVKTQDYISNEKENCSVFFSGGIDSVSSLVSVIHKNPLLITIWGTDVWDYNEEGWKSLKDLALEYSEKLHLKNLFIKTNFRKFIYEHVLTKELLEGKIDDSWWRGIQHGIGLLGHVAPYAYKYNIKTHYIPATLNVKSQKGTTCGSCPEIDETVQYANCHIVHEGYDKTRIEKAAHIVNYFKNEGKTMKLRVCYMDKGDKLNCCECEKCFLSIMEILSQKVDPNDWGFEITGEQLRNIHSFLKEKANPSPINKEIWMDIKNEFAKDKKYWKKQKDIKWIFKYNPYHKSLKEKIMRKK